MKKVTDDDIRRALKETNGGREAAGKLLGLNVRTLRRRLERIPDIAPWVYPLVPDGHKLRGVSTLSKILDQETGEMVLQWTKTAEDVQAREKLLQTVLEALRSDLPRIAPTAGPKAALPAELASLYILTDYHVGMLAWDEEAGDNWDLKIAESLLMRWIQYSVKHSPRATQGILYQGGDFLHYDSLEAVTPRSAHVLDADSRPQKMVRVAIRALRYIITMLLKKHDTVHVIMAEGNHDPMASAWLRETFAMMYQNEPRITVEIRPDPYYSYTWGETSLFFHHGHLRKPANIDSVFVRKFREQYGKTQYAYAHMGHLHHWKGLEGALMKVEQHPTLAAADAYASRGGWLADRMTTTITYHKRYGEVGRMNVTPKMVSDE